MSGSQLSNELRRILCTLGVGALFVWGATTASGGNDDGNGCKSPGNHYGFVCDPAPSGTDPTSPPSDSPPSGSDSAPPPGALTGGPIPARAPAMPRSSGGLCQLFRA